MSKRTEMKKRWDAFVQAFAALGNETFGMSPSAACVLLSAVVEVENNWLFVHDCGCSFAA